jgi:colanic acid/amylovoran biosynthesis glycosyltransferase
MEMNNNSFEPDHSIIRVAHVKTDWLPVTENWLYWLVTRTPANVEDHVLCQATFNLEQFPVAHLHPIMSSPAVRSMSKLLGLRETLRKYTYARVARQFALHLVHSHFGETGWHNLSLVRSLQIPHIVSFYGLDVSAAERNDSWRTRYRNMFEQNVTVLCQGPYMRERIIAQGARPEQVRIFRLGIDVDHLPYRPRKWIGSEPLRVLIAGRFVEKKGIPYAIDALARIAPIVPLEIHLVGAAGASAASQAEQARILAAIKRGGLASRMVQHGLLPYDALMDLSYQCHIFLSPSVRASDGDDEGGAPIAINEMAAAGMPIVSTIHCDIPYAVGERNALLAPERDADALADCLLKLVQDTESWRPMLDRARVHVEQRYNIDKQGEQLAKIYHEKIAEI